jgi:hypothetical protein
VIIVSIIPGHVTRVTDAPARRVTPNWLKAVYATLATLIAIVALSLAFSPNGDELKPCKSEDQKHCYWDADTMGNGHGHDVVSR